MNISTSKSGLRRVLVLGLDGYPHSLLRKRLDFRPNSIWHRCLEEGTLRRMNSSRPEVSSVAWASYLTGVNPGQHGLFGFVDRTLDPFRLYFPNGKSLRVPTILERVHELDGTVISVNFPATFPPRKLRGLVVGGFLGVRLETNVQPESWLNRLRHHNYTIDVDPAKAYSNLNEFYSLLEKALDARYSVAMEAASEFDWDLFQLHIMETDRMFHFFWDREEWTERFQSFLDRVDEIVESMVEMGRKKNAVVVILSDHGFTRTRRIFFINAFLRKSGCLAFDSENRPGLENLSESSRAYALPPGRVFINLKGREPNGTVNSGAEYEAERDRLATLLREVKDPLDNQTVFSEVVKREDIYHGLQVDRAADLIAFGREGMDIKADFANTDLFESPTTLVGTHTFDDAFMYVKGDPPPWNDNEGNISDAGKHVTRLLGFDIRAL